MKRKRGPRDAVFVFMIQTTAKTAAWNPAVLVLVLACASCARPKIFLMTSFPQKAWQACFVGGVLFTSCRSFPPWLNNLFPYLI